MTMIQPMRFIWLLAGLLPLLACDSKRDNPLDPELTPPVELRRLSTTPLA